VIHYRNRVRRSGVDGRALVSTAQALLDACDEPDSSLSLTLVNDAAIRELNREHRGQDGDPERLLGDVVISVDTARRQAADYDAALQAEMYRLLIHGLLHVLGHDHEQPHEREVMVREERRLASVIALPWPYPE
jgi:probable rRNA maturation factor